MSSTETQVTGWVGWGVFASVILIIAGVIDALYGLVAIIGPNSVYFATVEGELFVLNIAGWGWWHLIVGILLVLTGLALLTGATWARVIAIILAALSGISQLFLLPVQPWWSLVVLALDVLVIFALTEHGRELKVR